MEAAAEQVNALVQDGELRARVGAASRQEVSLWDWRAATQHLVAVQVGSRVRGALAGAGSGVGGCGEGLHVLSATVPLPPMSVPPVQYPLAMAAAAVYYGRSLGSVTAAAAAAGGGDAGAGRGPAGGAAPAMAA